MHSLNPNFKTKESTSKHDIDQFCFTSQFCAVPARDLKCKSHEAQHPSSHNDDLSELSSTSEQMELCRLGRNPQFLKRLQTKLDSKNLENK
jgi:hypothetical protein